jgi:Caspase domain
MNRAALWPGMRKWETVPGVARSTAIRIAVLAAVLWSSSAAARTVGYAIAIGNNTPPSPSLPVLHYADDDAVRYHQLFSRFAVEAHLLAVLDDQTQRRYPGLGASAQAPTLANLARIVTAYAGKMAADVQRGDRPVLYLAFSGHGFADGDGAFLAMLDGPLTRERLYTDVIGRLPAAYVHLIVDACNAGAVVGVRGPTEVDAKPAEVTPSDRLAVAEGEQRTWPTVGVVIAATAGEESHEWSRLESGVFTHEVISGLLGAADVNHDGQIEYSELAAFIAAANRDIADPRAAPRVIVRPPPIDRSAPLVTVDALRDAVFLTGDASAIGHFYLELGNGQRYLDAHLTAGAARIAMPAHARVFVRTTTHEAAIATGASGSVAIDDLAFRPSAVVARGSLDVAYASGLFRHPYGDAYYRGFVDSAGLPAVAFAVDATVRMAPAGPDRRFAIGFAAVAGVAGITAVVSGAFAYSAKRSYDATDLERDAHDAAVRYTLDLRIAIGSGVVAAGAALVSYWRWPHQAAPPIAAVIDAHGAAIHVIGRF